MYCVSMQFFLQRHGFGEMRSKNHNNLEPTKHNTIISRCDVARNAACLHEVGSANTVQLEIHADQSHAGSDQHQSQVSGVATKTRHRI